MLSADPDDGKTLSKAANNVVRLTFNSAVTLPGGAPLSIVPLAGGGDLAAGFAYSLESGGTVVKAKENNTVLTNRTWYRVQPSGAFNVLPFRFDVCTLIGDADADGAVQAFDLGVLWSHAGEVTDARYDIDGDGTVQAFDLGVAWTHAGETKPPKP